MVVRSLIWIGRFYRMVTQINLFSMTTLYALSSLTMRIGVIFVAFLLINILGAPLHAGTQNQPLRCSILFCTVRWRSWCFCSRCSGSAPA